MRNTHINCIVWDLGDTYGQQNKPTSEQDQVIRDCKKEVNALWNYVGIIVNLTYNHLISEMKRKKNNTLRTENSG